MSGEERMSHAALLAAGLVTPHEQPCPHCTSLDHCDEHCAKRPTPYRRPLEERESVEDGAHEWSIVSDASALPSQATKPKAEFYRLFVIADEAEGYILIDDHQMTSGSPTARKMRGRGTNRDVSLTLREAEWLAETLPKAVEAFKRSASRKDDTQ